MAHTGQGGEKSDSNPLAELAGTGQCGAGLGKSRIQSGRTNTGRTEEGGSMAGAGLGGVAPRVRPEGALINAENGGNMRRKKACAFLKRRKLKLGY